MNNELDLLKAAWPCLAPAPAPLQAAGLRTLVAARYQREQRVVGRYVWGAALWQAMVYTSLAYLGWRFRLDGPTLAACVLGTALYLPFTLVFWRKFRGFTRRQLASHPADAPLAAQVGQQYGRLSQFFRFKKRFDVLATPLTALVLVTLFIRVGWVPPITQSPGPAAALFALIVVIFALALRWENQHQFAGPLRRLQDLRQELADDTEVT
ncbi:hypothetical protein [Hymenobacter negativus]|uniref:Uncharacterized protein n=1 Tax=Hymenobacter negativus TaxID=2795026 RepID=A0ABS3QK47_9BACT|nr:hypothetical protein [Hymenobacter negativus]MBO2011621.1 hypothetical protein [Hymenobacter negativus]